MDLNPLALELARMSLWLEAMTPDKPLGFLDHHLQCGDALELMSEVVYGGVEWNRREAVAIAGEC
ncbi:hypothetical protein, partial [Burkholderia ubonensis]|uniref:hypothetical protein n=1 Tax=Burkholderia ubonensis TaxID=101571 RepID=UPI001E4D0E9A